MNGQLSHTQPLVAVAYTGRRKPHQAPATFIALMIDPPDYFDESVALHVVCHN
jgi:hypothetical protein